MTEKNCWVDEPLNVKMFYFLQGLALNPVCIPLTGWDKFPSKDIPRNFNFGSVYYYLVESAPIYAGEDQSESESSGDEEEIEVIKIRDPFEDHENDNMLRSKKLRRGLMYYKSNFIRDCKDTLEGQVHHFKGHVRASMNMDAYWVHVAVSQVSGSIIFCRCDKNCSLTLGRCSHVGAMLLYILGHTRLNGYDGKSRQTTSSQILFLKYFLLRKQAVLGFAKQMSLHTKVTYESRYVLQW